MFCTAVKKYSRNPVVQHRRFRISKAAHYCSSKCLTICSYSFNFDIAFLNATCAKNKVINYGTENSQLSDFRYSEISLEAFLLTAFRTSGNNSECFVMLLAAACQFLSHTCLTKHLVVSSQRILTRTFSDSVLKTTLTWRPPSGRLSMFRYWSILSLFSFSEAFPAPIPKISVKSFPCLFWSPAITLEPICRSDSFPLECPVSTYLLKLTLVE